MNNSAIKYCVILLSILLNIPGFSQESSDKNAVKVNVSAFAFKGFGLQYERQIGRKITVALGYSKIPEGNIAFQSAIKNLIDDPDVNVGDFKLGTSIITPEIRFYLSKKGAFHGFYLAPYGRFSGYTMQVPVNYSSTNADRTAVFSGKINNSTFGLLLGSQFKPGGKLYLDWWIIGAGIGSASGNLVAATPLSPTEQNELKNELDNLDVPFTTIKSQVNNNGATVTTTGSMAGIRGLGLNLSFRI